MHVMRVKLVIVRDLRGPSIPAHDLGRPKYGKGSIKAHSSSVPGVKNWSTSLSPLGIFDGHQQPPPSTACKGARASDLNCFRR